MIENKDFQLTYDVFMEAIESLRSKYSVPNELDINKYLLKKEDIKILDHMKKVKLDTVDNDLTLIKYSAKKKQFEFTYNTFSDVVPVPNTKPNAVKYAK